MSAVEAARPLPGLRLAPHGVLEAAQRRGRLKCSKCGGSRMFFCYTCCSLLGVELQDVPLVAVRPAAARCQRALCDTCSAAAL
ncbi:DTW domain-containing protein 1 [Liparis tanakae]|uniref:DTW domain-containing protein 1 n=1 Tax=Liparis tanakae TaxID=230148 RepID=A0A4Z2ECW6_9TELE|nr:DTW domain-containing protein 1 [Liparis tanakae]